MNQTGEAKGGVRSQRRPGANAIGTASWGQIRRPDQPLSLIAMRLQPRPQREDTNRMDVGLDPSGGDEMSFNTRRVRGKNSSLRNGPFFLEWDNAGASETGWEALPPPRPMPQWIVESPHRPRTLRPASFAAPPAARSSTAFVTGRASFDGMKRLRLLREVTESHACSAFPPP